VQDIPSAWQFYTRRYLLAAFIVLGGLALGWTLANYQQVLALLNSQPNQSVVSVPAPVSSTAEQVKETLDNDIKPAPQVDKPKDVNSDVVANVPVQPTTVTEEVIQSAQVSENIPVITPTPEPQISADVLARFRKAMTEVEELPTELAPSENVLSQERNKVPRVDQLPAWVMNRLPSMAFSAHMYASVDSERWVRVNGTRMVEGDKIDGVVEIVRIEPQHVILNYSGQEFSMAALTVWYS
jgi:general secretion pathway protein B